MIKRFRIAAPSADPTGQPLQPWATVVDASTSAPARDRPVRIAACTTVPELSPGSPCDAVSIEWFHDAEHLDRFDNCGRSSPGERRSGAPTVEDALRVVVAEEMVMRGAEWLEQRWQSGGEAVKQMALAKRAAGLTATEFSERWKARAGTLSTSGGRSLEIPAAAKGKAYIQNHPYPRPSGEWDFDAVNEVYFDDMDALRLRIEWFAEHLQAGAEGDLVSRSWFVVFRERPVL